jgi:hypothetical protein
MLLYFSGPSGLLTPAPLSVENKVPLKPVLGGLRDVALFHYPSCKNSIKPSLQFLCNFANFLFYRMNMYIVSSFTILSELVGKVQSSLKVIAGRVGYSPTTVIRQPFIRIPGIIQNRSAVPFLSLYKSI